MDYFAPLATKLKKRKDLNFDLIQEAYVFAYDAHQGQKRASGEDYIMHPTAVAELIYDIGGDEESIIASLLHDTVEDNKNIALDHIRKKFGENVEQLVDGVTKIEKVFLKGTESLDHKIETIRKWLNALHTDVRIAVIKLCDQLHNLGTLHAFKNKEKQARIAQQTLDIYVKVSKWLSISKMQEKLEKLALPHVLDSKTSKYLFKKESEYKENTKKAIKIFEQSCENQNMSFKVGHIPLQKAYFSLQEGKPSKEVFAAHIYCIVPNIEKCYSALYFFHGTWRQKKGSFDDYINSPRMNGSRALNTRLIFEGGTEVEVHIMTEEMFNYSQKGVASFCFSKNVLPYNPPWIEKLKNLLETNKKKSYEFWKGIQSDLLEGFILVHGPNDKVISLPQQSTYLDAAFAYLKEKAISLEKITSQGKEVSFSSKVKEGVVVNFILGKGSLVNYNWLEFVDNILSISIIKDALRKKNITEKERLGRRLLQDEFDKKGLGLIDEIKEEKILILCQDLGINSTQDLFQKIGEVFIFPSEVSNHLLSENQKQESKKTEEEFQYYLRCKVERGKLDSFYGIIAHTVKKADLLPNKNENSFIVKVVIQSSNEEKNILIREIRRAIGMRVLDTNTPKKMWFSIGILGFLSILWGVGLVLADYLVDVKNIEPLLFSTSRLWTVAIIMAAIFFFQSFNKHLKGLEKPLNMAHWSFWGSVFSFMGIPIFTYLALDNATASEYVLFMLTHSIFVLLALMIERKRFISKSFLIPIVISLGIGYFFFLWKNPHFNSLGQLFVFLSVLSFAGYSYTSSYYIKNLGIRSRYPKFLSSISFFGACFSTLVYTIFVGQIPSVSHLIPVVFYSIFFSGVAYVLYYVLIHREGYTSYVGYSFFGFLGVTYLSQIMFLEIAINSYELLALPFLITAVLLSGKGQKTIPGKNK
jgi:GTP diphosphokinase / guanosine-3',5'-bis(diphosphate) 3'-diphosphatase